MWTIHGERIVDDTRLTSLSIADVELPNGVRFEQYVLRSPRAAIVVVLDDAGEQVLMMWRHRFIIDRWVWELPGGYVDAGEDSALAAAREVEEETGWRPAEPRFIVSFQPTVGVADAPTDLYVARGAERAGTDADINEAQSIAWLPLSEIRARIDAGEIVGAGSILGLLYVLARFDHPQQENSVGQQNQS
jgi:8-oxo-dGTP pyrophosphatase MutT (NUDIX family)